nr:ABC transporter permease subunit [Bacillus licheniformis]
MSRLSLPFAVLPLASSLSEVKPDLKFASMSLGAGRSRTFFFVTLPMTVPGLLTGAMIVFSLSAGSYITPLLVGGRMRTAPAVVHLSAGHASLSSSSCVPQCRLLY